MLHLFIKYLFRAKSKILIFINRYFIPDSMKYDFSVYSYFSLHKTYKFQKSHANILFFNNSTQLINSSIFFVPNHYNKTVIHSLMQIPHSAPPLLIFRCCIYLYTASSTRKNSPTLHSNNSILSVKTPCVQPSRPVSKDAIHGHVGTSSPVTQTSSSPYTKDPSGAFPPP